MSTSPNILSQTPVITIEDLDNKAGVGSEKKGNHIK